MSRFPEDIDWEAARAEEARLSRAELVAFIGLTNRPGPDLYVERTDAASPVALDEEAVEGKTARPNLPTDNDAG